jgi:hypothetical protein
MTTSGPCRTCAIDRDFTANSLLNPHKPHPEHTLIKSCVYKLAIFNVGVGFAFVAEKSVSNACRDGEYDFRTRLRRRWLFPLTVHRWTRSPLQVPGSASCACFGLLHNPHSARRHEEWVLCGSTCRDFLLWLPCHLLKHSATKVAAQKSTLQQFRFSEAREKVSETRSLFHRPVT